MIYFAEVLNLCDENLLKFDLNEYFLDRSRIGIFYGELNYNEVSLELFFEYNILPFLSNLIKIFTLPYPRIKRTMDKFPRSISGRLFLFFIS